MESPSTNLDSPEAQPYFIWDVPITVAKLRERLRHPEPRERALWMARVMREALYHDVWRLLSVHDVLDHYALIQRHLGRRRRFWNFLLQGWRDDGLI